MVVVDYWFPMVVLALVVLAIVERFVGRRRWKQQCAYYEQCQPAKNEWLEWDYPLVPRRAMLFAHSKYLYPRPIRWGVTFRVSRTRCP